ncbi:6223_t:CDS:2 [Acaulospora colombiana]|uniref:6223_t:CDS:1 n=1 Tax=Acaulospora colombiana TaxID=27376 RepID=A0ACA9KGI1_9GLOM|nr:6223_t:CDS:2 [Acaulospora colombiana]
MSVVSGISPIKEHIMTDDHVDERKPFSYGPSRIESLLESVSDPRTETDFAKITTEINNENAAERGIRINNVQRNEKSVQNTEPMDWTPTKSDATLPSPRTRSCSGSESPAAASRTVAVNLFPLTDSIVFSPKHLTFAPEQEIKVGRVSGSRNQKEAKAENGVFICDVMSREHAMLKESNGKILIKDTKSTHGTFVNDVRLGDGSKDSEWKELKHGDVITFGHSVRRNQSLYKHLSAYVFYPKEKKEVPPIPISSNNIQNYELPSESTNSANHKSERSEEKVPTTTSACIAKDLSTEVPADGFVSAASMQNKVEKSAEVQKEHKSTKISESRAVPSGVSSGVSGQKSSASSNMRETRQSEEVDTSASAATTTAAIAPIKPKPQIVAVKQERRSVTSERNVAKFDIPVVKDEVVPTDDFHKFADDHKLVTPAITPDACPLEETTVNLVTIKNTAVSIKEKPSTQMSRETKHSKESHKDEKINEKINNESTVNNGEGPSNVTETTNSTVSVISRKRKYEELDYEECLQQVNELNEKLAVLEMRANKRRRWELIASTVVGMVAGVVSIGVGAYMLGN